jgi:uncharacterized membrane protein YccC
MYITDRNLAFVLANTIAVMVALYIAFASDLERPYSAMFTVFIVAQPITGAVRSKAAFRFLGTVAGAAMTPLLVPPLVHAPILLCLATSLWIGLCLYLSLQDRRPRSYAFLLAGYSIAIVGLSVVNAPNTIFDTSVARVEEISIGLVCAAVAHSVFFPQNVLDELTGRIDRTLRRGGTWIADELVARQSVGLEAEQQLAELVPNAGKESDYTPGRVGQGSRQSLNPTPSGAFLNGLRWSRVAGNALEHTTVRSQHPGACGSNRFRTPEVEVVPCDPWQRP